MELQTIWVGRKSWVTFSTLDLSQMMQGDANWLTRGPICGQEMESGCHSYIQSGKRNSEAMELRTIWVGRKFWGTFSTLDLSQMMQGDANWLTRGPICGQEMESGCHSYIQSGKWNSEAMELRTIWVGRKFWGTFSTLFLLQILKTDENWLTCGPAHCSPLQHYVVGRSDPSTHPSVKFETVGMCAPAMGQLA
jgi:hypothetical protein